MVMGMFKDSSMRVGPRPRLFIRPMQARIAGGWVSRVPAPPPQSLGRAKTPSPAPAPMP